MPTDPIKLAEAVRFIEKGLGRSGHSVVPFHAPICTRAGNVLTSWHVGWFTATNVHLATILMGLKKEMVKYEKKPSEWTFAPWVQQGGARSRD